MHLFLVMFSNANSVIVIYPNSSQSNAPMADSKPMTAVAIIMFTFIKSNPITSNCNSSSNAGNENTAINTRGAIMLYKNIFSLSVSVEIYLLGSSNFLAYLLGSLSTFLMSLDYTLPLTKRNPNLTI